MPFQFQSNASSVKKQVVTQHVTERMIWLTHLRLFIFPIYPQETYYFYKTVILLLDK